MFIRKTIIINRENKKEYFNFQLVESYRTERGPRQRILLNLGTDLDLNKQECKALANRIEELLQGAVTLIPYPEKIEQLAQLYASQVVQHLSKVQPEEDSAFREAQQDFINIDVNSVEKFEPRTVGAEDLMLQMARQLQLPQKLQQLGLSETDLAIALGSIIARAVAPNSERSTYAWLCKDSGLGELLDFDFTKSSLDKLYQVSDKLLSHKHALEEHLEDIEQQLHGYTSVLALYDLTNTYLEGQGKSNPKAAHGVSKEKRFDCSLVTMGLMMNEHGFLKRTSILPGNASEPQTLEEMIEQLGAHESLFKPIIILDAGIATESNLAWLKQHHYKYVVSARQKAPSIELEGELVAVGDLHDCVKAALVKSDDNEEKWLYCESEAKAVVATQMKQSFRRRFEEDLQRLAVGLAKPKGRKRYIKIMERLGRLKEKHNRISGCYEIKVIASENGAYATAIEWRAVEEKMSEKLTGKYFLRTNLVEMSPQALWQLYNTLRNVEDAFRFMKSSLGLRPIYHQKEQRVDGHLWITILAYHLIQNCLYQLQQQKIGYHWDTVRRILLGRVRVTMQAKTQDGKTLYLRSTTKAEGEQTKIYRVLGLSTSILRSKKTVI